MKTIKKEILSKFNNLKIDEETYGLHIYGFRNQLDELIINNDDTIDMINLGSNGDDVWEVINFIKKEFNLKTN